MAFSWSQSDSKTSQASWTLLSILANLSNAAVLMVSIRPLISNSTSLFSKSLNTVPRAPITIDITVNPYSINFQ